MGKKINISAARRNCALAFLRVIAGPGRAIVRNGTCRIYPAMKKVKK